jgi:hypothetical protein
MKRDISVLFEGIQGIKAWFDEVTAAYNFGHYGFEAVVPESPEGLPFLKVFPDPRYPDKFFTITPDLERELWVRSNAESDADHYPLGLYGTIIPWILDAIAGSHEYFITSALGTDSNKLVVPGSSKHLSVQTSLWGFAVRLLIDSANGDLDDWFSPQSAENRAEAALRLPYRVAKFWEWENSGLENRLSEQGVANLEFLKSEFRKLGFDDNYEVNWAQVAAHHGEVMAKILIDHAVELRDEKQQNEENKERSRKILGWVVPLAIGSLIAVGAALGY